MVGQEMKYEVQVLTVWTHKHHRASSFSKG